MSNVKEELHRMIDELPDDATYEDLQRQIRLRRKLDEPVPECEPGENPPPRRGEAAVSEGDRQIDR